MLDERIRKVVKTLRHTDDPQEVKNALWKIAFKQHPQPHQRRARVQLFNGFIDLILKACRSGSPNQLFI
jgi:hypothetical protein